MSLSVSCYGLFAGEGASASSTTSTSTTSGSGNKGTTESGADVSEGDGSDGISMSTPTEVSTSFSTITATTLTSGSDDSSSDTGISPHPCTPEIEDGPCQESISCNTDCSISLCGDKILNKSDSEECDPAEPDPNCIECKLLCGNGILDGLEECDHGLDGNGAHPKFCTSTCKKHGLIAFVSRDPYTGNLGGIAGADTKCEAMALDIPQPPMSKGPFRAWLSQRIGLEQVEGGSPSGETTRFSSCGRPYYRPDGALLAESYGALVDNKPIVPISVDQFVMPVSLDAPEANTNVWTATTNGGFPMQDMWKDLDCYDWNEDNLDLGEDFHGRIGDLSSKDDWTNAPKKLLDCGEKAHLYCFEQAPDPCPPPMP